MTVSAELRRLGLGSLAQVPTEARPRVDPRSLGSGILHLGLGAFHRAHQAVYTEDAIAAAGGDWGIVGVAPRSRDVLERLAAQDRLYSVLSLDADRAVPRVVGVHTELVHAAGDPESVLARLADPAIRVVTFTVTEKAYGTGSGNGWTSGTGPHGQGAAPDPGGVMSLLVRGLIRRAGAGAGPIALVSCDNLPGNGHVLRRVVHERLALAGQDDVLAWVGEEVGFPTTMVDRIVPATTPELLERAGALLGVSDAAPVCAEPFRQWVIEDDFPGGRPAWDRAGAVLTDDVEPWERMKLRALNSLHSALAYLGALAGVETIAEALRLPGATDLLRRFVDEDIAPTLAPPPGQDARTYADTVLERFANPALGHRTLQVAMDGTQKLPQRLIGTITDRRQAGASPRWAALVLSGWMRFVRGRADDGGPLPLNDPLADTLRAAVRAAPDTPEGLAGALLGVSAVIPPELADDEELRTLVISWLRVLDRHGVRGALREAATP